MKPQPRQDAGLRFDGLYFGGEESTGEPLPDPRWVRSYLRFHPDGTVVGCASTEHPISAARHLSPMDGYAGVGTYAIDGKAIRFPPTHSYGLRVDNDGEIHGDRLELRWSSHPDGKDRKEGTMVLRFIEVGVNASGCGRLDGLELPWNSVRIRPPA